MHGAGAGLRVGSDGKAPVDTRAYAELGAARRGGSGFAVWGTAVPSEDTGTQVQHREWLRRSPKRPEPVWRAARPQCGSGK